MRRLINYLRSWFIASKVSRQLGESEQRLTALERDCGIAKKLFERYQRNLERIFDQAQEHIERASILTKQYEEALEKERAANRVHEKTIEGLVAQSETFVKRWETQTAVEVMKQTGARPRTLDDDV
ncbi:hypothetical protein LCGC14_0249170 [marine sediment metagenome]|uniref:Uncharacterized protein n=1 Tax=marine sediment metagenome TaxID=412755 RepID=A0A0F9U9Q7_9ZZZZ